MRQETMLLLICVATSACDRERADRGGVEPDTTQGVEDAAALTTLLAPLRALSRAEVEFGQLASVRSPTETVRQYGQTVAADHRAVLTLLDELAAQRGATLSETGSALEVSNMVRMAHSGLENLSGPDFDLPFVRAEVESHRQLLDRLDQQAIPAASSEEVRNMLADLRAMADAHLTRARQLLSLQLAQTAEPQPQPARPSVPRPPTPPDTASPRQPPPTPPPQPLPPTDTTSTR